MVEPLSNQVVAAVAEPVVVRDHLAVDLLLHIEATRRLAPFMRRDHTLGSAAKELDMPASSLAYWVKRYQKAGLVKVVRHIQRAGKPIPVYRAIAGEFQVPLDAMPPGVRDEFLNGGRRRMFEEFTSAVDVIAEKFLKGGIRVRAHPDRGVELTIIDSERDIPVPVAESWSTLALTEDEAREIQKVLDELGRRYLTDVESPGRKQYVMVLGLVPKPRR